MHISVGVLRRVCGSIVGADLTGVSLISADWSLQGETVWETPNYSALMVDAPSIASMSDGALACSFAAEPRTSNQVFWNDPARSTQLVFTSSDDGATWTNSATVSGALWGSLFSDTTYLYWIGVRARYGEVAIMRSVDASAWSDLTTIATGTWHSASHPVPSGNGRLYAAFADTRGYTSASRTNWAIAVVSAAVESDLTNAESWTVSNEVVWNHAWSGEGWYEPCVIVSTNGVCHVMARVQFSSEAGNVAALLDLSQDGQTLSFSKFVTFPGGEKKFFIRQHDTGYYATANPVNDKNLGCGRWDKIRNTLSILTSTDLETWSAYRGVIFNPLFSTVAYQYTSWIEIEGDMLLVSRTGFSTTNATVTDPHDANLCTFHRFEGVFP